MMRAASIFGSGVLFSVGLALAGMTTPEKVIGFLDFFGSWDPSLMFVMGGAVAVYGLGLRLVLRRPAPVWAPRFGLPTRRDLDARLIGGAVLFGAGWGLAGYCPGPALASLATLAPSAAIFTVSMVSGMLAFEALNRLRARRATFALET